MELLKRIRGAFGTAMTWAAGWFGVGAIFGLVAAGATNGMYLGGALFFSVFFAMCGFVGGATFSVLLRLAEGHRRFDEMSLPRFGGWGAVGSLPLSLLLLSTGWLGYGIEAVLVVIVLTLLGSMSALGSLRLARWSDKEMLEGGEDIGEVGLTESEKRELLGS